MIDKPLLVLECPKCGEQSGNSWIQCEKKCPVDISPHFVPKLKKKI